MGRVVTVPVVGAIVVVVVVDEALGFHILNVQNVRLVIGEDSGSKNFISSRFLIFLLNLYLLQNSVPLATPTLIKYEFEKKRYE